MNNLNLDCYTIEPAENFISLLSKPITTYKKLKESNLNLYGKWIQYFVELYNSRSEFLLMAKTKISNTKKNVTTVDKTFDENYEAMKSHFSEITKSDMMEGNQELRLNCRKSFVDNQCTLNKYINIENNNKKLLQQSIFKLTVFMFQYLHEFEEKSINMNLWNYCLKSSTFSKRSFFTGLIILICQYTWIIALIYNTANEFELNDDILVILITITSTFISIFYSYDSLLSFINSIPLYKFLLKLYSENPTLILSNEERSYLYYKDRNITMTKCDIYYNFVADFLSNFILPIVIPIINVFIILTSDSIIDAILNCIAIFFIINIDEELYNITDYKQDQITINFTRWIISNIYCKQFPDFIDIFKYECDNWQNNVLRLAKKIKKKNKVEPNRIDEMVINMDELN